MSQSVITEASTKLVVTKLEKQLERFLTPLEEAMVDYVLTQVRLGLVEVKWWFTRSGYTSPNTLGYLFRQTPTRKQKQLLGLGTRLASLRVMSVRQHFLR
jgi:hypothetical protein